MYYPPTPQRKACDCSDPCISTDDVYYAGPNLPNSGINTYNVLTEVIEKLDAIYAVPTLQRVTEVGNYTTLPIIADSFVKIGGDGNNLLLDDGTVLPIGDLPTGVTETSQLINDGEDGINPFITALDIPAFIPSDYDLDEFTNTGIDPFAHVSDIPAPLGYTPVNKAGDTMLGDLILNEDPSTALGAATKQYVDNIAAGINFHSPVTVATDISLVATYDNGVDGLGATLTGTSVGVLTVDGETPTYLQRILVWQQANAIENGIYDLTTVGDGTTIYQLTRSADADNSPVGEIQYGDYVLVLSGDTNGGFGFICNTAGTITIGVTPINYVQFNAAQAITAGYGLQELTPNVISINPAETQEKITLTTTGTGAATLVSNTLNIPESTNYWTKTGNDIANNNTGNVNVGNGVYASLFYANSSLGSFAFRADIASNTKGLAIYSSGSSNPIYIVHSSTGDIFKAEDGLGNTKSKMTSSGLWKYGVDLSSTYDDRTLVDKGYITSYTTAQLAGKMNNPSLTASYIPKALTATTIGNSRLLDTGTYLGISTVNTPTKDITLGYQANKEIGIELSDSTTVGRDLTVAAGKTINYNLSSNFVALSQTVQAYRKGGAAANGDFYISAGFILYKQSLGSGNLALYHTSSYTIYSTAVDSSGNIYIATTNGLYKQTSGSGPFVLESGVTTRSYLSMAFHPDGHLYAVTAAVDTGGTIDYIYKRTNNTGDFVAVSVGTARYNDVACAPNGDVYVSQWGTGIIKQTGGTGSWSTILSSTSTGTVCVLSNGTIYAANVYGGVAPYFYISINNGVSFSTSSVTLPVASYSYLVSNGNNVYDYSLLGSDIYFQNNASLGTSNLQGGTLKLNSGTGKGTGASDIEMYTGQVLASGTDMQTATLRAKINNEGLMTLPSVTNALIEADTTGKAVVTKEYVNNRLVVETTSGYTLTNADSGGIVIFKTTAAQTLTIPTGLAAGFECTFVTLAGVTLIVSATGVTLNNNTSTTLLPQLSFTLKRMLATNTYITAGSL